MNTSNQRYTEKFPNQLVFKQPRHHKQLVNISAKDSWIADN